MVAYLSEDNGNANNYLYNEKELNDDHNLYWYCYGARYYDPQLGRWMQVDVSDQFNSPYIYCNNNPVNLIDPDGRTTPAKQAQVLFDVYFNCKPETDLERKLKMFITSGQLGNISEYDEIILLHAIEMAPGIHKYNFARINNDLITINTLSKYSKDHEILLETRNNNNLTMLKNASKIISKINIEQLITKSSITTSYKDVTKVIKSDLLQAIIRQINIEAAIKNGEDLDTIIEMDNIQDHKEK